MRDSIFIRLVWVLFLLVSHLVDGQDAGRVPVTRAVVIGISTYKNLDPSLQLAYAHKDARAFYDLVVSGGFGPINRENITFLTNEEAQMEQVEQAIKFSLLGPDVQSGDQTILYFAGHGDVQSEFNAPFLLTNDAPQSKDYHLDGAVEIDDLEKYVGRAADRGVNVVLIVDACHSGKIISKLGARMTLQALTKDWENVIKVVSCGPDQSSYENSKWGGGHGVFTFYLLKAFQGLADSDNDQKIRVFELDEYLRKQVREETDFKQIPKCTGQDTKVVVEVMANLASTSVAGKNKKEKAPVKRGIGQNPFLLSTAAARGFNLPAKFRFPIPGDSLEREFISALKTQFYTRMDLPDSKPVLFDTSAKARYYNPSNFLLVGQKGNDSLILASKEGAFKWIRASDFEPLDSGHFSPSRVNTASVSGNILVWTDYKESMIHGIDLSTQLPVKIRWKEQGFSVKKLELSPDWRYLVVVGGKNSVVLFDMVKQKRVFIRHHVWTYVPDRILFSKDKSGFYLISFKKDQKTIWFPCRKREEEEQPVVIHQFPKTIKEGDLVQVESSNQLNLPSLVLYLKDKPYPFPQPWDSILQTGIPQSQKNLEFRIQHQELVQHKDSIWLRMNRFNSFSLQTSGFSDSVFLRSSAKELRIFPFTGQHKYLLHQGNELQLAEGIVRPSLSAEELLARMRQDKVQVRKHSALLASILEMKGTEILDWYSETGKLESDSVILSNSIEYLKKAIRLYNDTNLSRNAQKRLLFLTGLHFGLSDNRLRKDSARIYFEKLRQLYPRASFPLNALAELLNHEAQTSKAKELLVKAMELTPRWSVPRQNLGNSYFIEGKLDTARKQLELLSAKPGFTVDAGIRLIEIYRRYGDVRRAEELARKLSVVYPDDADLAVKSAQVYADKGLYYKSWQTLFKIHKTKAYYPPMVLALLELPGKASDKWSFLNGSMERYPDNMAIRFHSILHLQNPSNRNLPVEKAPGLLKTLEMSMWKPELVDIVGLGFRKNGSPELGSGLEKVLPPSIGYQDLFELCQGFACHKQTSKALEIAQIITKKIPDEASNWLLLSDLYLSKKQTENSLQAFRKAKSILTNIEKNGEWDAYRPIIRNYEIQLSRIAKTNPVSENMKERKDSLLVMIDSLLYFRDKCQLKTDELYLKSLLGSGPFVKMKHLFANRMSKQGFGLYKMHPHENFKLNLLESRILFQQGDWARSVAKLKEMAEKDPENALICKHLYEAAPDQSKDKRKYRSEYLNYAFKLTGANKTGLVKLGDQTILTDQTSDQHQFVFPFRIVNAYHIDRNQTVLSVKKETEDLSLLDRTSLLEVFPGRYTAVSEVLKTTDPQTKRTTLVAIVGTNTGIGVVSQSGNWVFDPIYSEIHSIRNGERLLFEIWQKEKVGIGNSSGKMLVPSMYDGIGWVEANRALMYEGRNDVCINLMTGKRVPGGCAQESKKESIDFRTLKPTDVPGEYHFGLRSAKFWQSYGYADKNERFVIPPVYEVAGDFLEVGNKILAFVMQDNKEGFIDLRGNTVIPLVYSNTSGSFESAMVQGVRKEIIIAMKGNYYGIIDSDNQEVIPFQFKKLEYITHVSGLNPKRPEEKVTLFCGELSEGFGLFDLNGNNVLPGYFSSVRSKGGKGLFEVKDEDQTYLFNLANRSLVNVMDVVEE